MWQSDSFQLGEQGKTLPGAAEDIFIGFQWELGLGKSIDMSSTSGRKMAWTRQGDDRGAIGRSKVIILSGEMT